MKKILIICGVVIIVVVIAIVALLGNIDSLVKKGVEKAGPIILEAPVTLKSVDISFSSGSGELRGFTVGNPKGYKTDYAFQMDSLKIDLDVGSVTSDKIHIKNVIIDSPNIIFEGGFGKSNLSQLQANAEAFTSGDNKQQETETDSQGKKIQIDYVKIQNASISASMGILQGKKLTIPLPTLELRDIGKKKEANISDALGEILGAVNKAVIPAVKSGVTSFGKGIQKSQEAVKEKAQKGLGKIKGLFGK